MSVLMAALAPATVVSPIDYLVIDQGTPPVTRRCTVTQFLNARAVSTGQVGVVGFNTGPLRISQLPFATQVYLNDLMIVDVGVPAITKKVPVGTILNVVVTNRSVNTEQNTANKSVLISELPT